MESQKIRNLSDTELEEQGRQTAERLFRLRFQMKLGQTEGVKKLRDMRKDVARIQTIARERTLAIRRDGVVQASSEASARPAGKPGRAVKKAKAAAPAKKGAR
jgi:large subunit ribosomal protein L29